MKNILKSVATIGALTTILIGASGAWFTSNAVVQDNVITTGTLAVSVDTAQDDTYVGTWGAPNAFTVVDAGVQVGNFITWSNAAPADTNSYVVGVRNGSTIPFKFRAGATGAWVSTPAWDGACWVAHPAGPDASLVEVTNVHQYASNNCEGQIGCENLYYALLTGPWTNTPGLAAGNWTGSGYYYGKVDGTGMGAGANAIINPGQFAIYRVDAELDSSADNCYQGATYNFDLGVDAYQSADPTPGF